MFSIRFNDNNEENSIIRIILTLVSYKYILTCPPLSQIKHEHLF